MYLLTAEEMRRLDQTAINQLGIPGIVLMENAGLQVVQEISGMLGDPRGRTIAVFAGKGNNGGDGFVVARHLMNAGAEVKVFLFADPGEITGDAKTNLDILQAMGNTVYPIMKPNNLNIVKLAMMYTDLVVDAIFGTGFKGTVSGLISSVIELINTSGRPVISVDIPSGLEADTGRVNGQCIKADSTVTFGQNKLGLIIGQGPQFVGKLTVADISIPADLVGSLGVRRFLTTREVVRGFIPERQSDSHKGTYGRLLVIGGSRGLTGAPAMTGMAALRAGTGLVTVAVPASLHDLMEVKLTEVMTKPLAETEQASVSFVALDTIKEAAETADVLAVGPGMSTNGSTVKLVRELLKVIDKPVVLDADGLNAFVGCVELFKSCQAPLVVTPHPGEMARLLGIKTGEVQNNRIEVAQAAAANWNAVVVLKGERTITAGPDGSLYINPTGNPGMATGGTGDVLTGIIAGLMAQGLSPLQAAAAGAYFHGLAGDLAAEDKGRISLIAGDVLDYLPLALKSY